MPRKKTEPKRRSFGTVIKEKNGKLTYMYRVPKQFLSRYPEGSIQKKHKLTVDPERMADGESFLAQACKAFKDDSWVPPEFVKQEQVRRSVTFKEYTDAWLERKKTQNGEDMKETSKQKIRESLELYLYPTFADMMMDQITTKDVLDWYDSFTPKHKNANREKRRNQVYKHLKQIMRSAVEEDYENTGKPLLEKSPCNITVQSFERAHVPVRPTDQQFQQLLSELPDWARLVAVLMDYAGLREGEACALKVHYISFPKKGSKDPTTLYIGGNIQKVKNQVTGKYDVVDQSPKTKSSKTTIPISNELSQILRDWIKERKLKNDDYLFTQPTTGQVVNPQNYRNAIRRACNNVDGLEHMRAHDLRGDFLSRLGENGASVAEIMRMGRHKSMAVASGYQTAAQERMRDLLHKTNNRKGDDPVQSSSTIQVQEDPAKGKQDEALQFIVDQIMSTPENERVGKIKQLPPALQVEILDLLPSEARKQILFALMN